MLENGRGLLPLTRDRWCETRWGEGGSSRVGDGGRGMERLVAATALKWKL